jgi:hypothetical protein
MLLLITAFAVLLSGCPTLAGAEAKPFEKPGQESQIVLVVMPKGDIHEGRKPFLKLACNACHRVVTDPAIPAPTEKSGPDLGIREVSISNGYELTSIISPSHIIPFEYRTEDRRISTMPDLTEIMTVKQLVDLLAYLRSLKKKE